MRNARFSCLPFLLELAVRNQHGPGSIRAQAGYHRPPGFPCPDGRFCSPTSECSCRRNNFWMCAQPGYDTDARGPRDSSCATRSVSLFGGDRLRSLMDIARVWPENRPPKRPPRPSPQRCKPKRPIYYRGMYLKNIQFGWHGRGVTHFK